MNNHKIYQKIKTGLLLFAITLSVLFVGCDKFIYDDLSDCPMGVYVSFYTVTVANDTMTVFPSKESQQHITLLVFNQDGVLVGTKNETLSIKNSVTDRVKMFIPIAQAGEYSFVAWSGTPNGFNLSNLNVGTSKKEDILAALAQSQQHIDASKRVELWQGEFRTHAPATGNAYTQSPEFGNNTVIFKDPAKFGSQYIDILVPMNEITRRVYFKVGGLGNIASNLNNLSFVIKDKNGVFDQSGNISGSSVETTFTPKIAMDANGNLLIDFLTLGKILENSQALLEVRFTDQSGKEQVYSYKLIDLIKADPKYSEIDYGLTYDYHLEMEFRFYIAITGEVMNWTLVSRDIILKPFGS